MDPLPETEKSKAAQAKALAEIEKLNKLLVSRGYPQVGFMEKPMLLTYIKAKELGLLDGE
jgi:hypothetical protein